MKEYILTILNCLFSYVIGSIPSGFIIARLHGVTDIREHGSGNIGATNVARVLGIKYFFIVFFCDFMKAYAYLFMLTYVGVSHLHYAVAAVALLLGNGFPIFLGFRGGKGVATSFGVLSMLQPQLLAYAFVCWFVAFAISQTVGIASVITLMFLPFCSLCMLQDISWMGLFTLFISVWGLFLHRSNIKSFYMGISK